MQNINIVPNKISESFSKLLPQKVNYGHKIYTIKEGERHLYPADYIAELKDLYTQNIGWHNDTPQNHVYHTMVLPKLYLLLNRIVLNIPNTYQLATIVKQDTEFAKSCCFPHPEKPFVGVYGLESFQRTLFKIEETDKAFEEALHNLSDILDCQSISFKGLIPSVWVETYRNVERFDYDAVFVNNTGIDIIDEVTYNLPQDYRSDIRQESALNCLRIGIDNLNKDEIIAITNSAIKRYRNERMIAKYKHRSLFSKPYSDSDKELWEMIADDYAEHSTVLADRKADESFIYSIAQTKPPPPIVLEQGDINCEHRINIEIDSDGYKVATCWKCNRKVKYTAPQHGVN